MRIIKLLCLLFILSSCNKYLGVVESDYIPTTELEDLFSGDIKKSNQIEISEINKIIYPSDNFNIGDISSAKIKKITSLEERSLSFAKDSIYFTKKDHLIILNLSDYKEVLKIKLNLDREEKIIKIFKHSNKNFIISNKSKLFILENSEITLVANFDKFINDEIILNNGKLFIFTVFGEFYEINLNNYELSFKSKFPVKHGVNIGSNNYDYKNQISHLFNSGTLVFLNQQENYEIENNYFLEDLNILSSLGYFEEFIDAPFGYNNYLYFIDRSGLISVFNPLESEFLWEVDVRSPISDYNFTEDGNLLLLLNNEVVIFDNFGNLIATLEHSNENPLKLVSDKDKILIIDEKGIDVLDLKSGSRINFFKNKFIGSVEYIHFDSNSYIKDSKVLYKFSE